MDGFADRKFDWVAGLASTAGVAVLVPSFLALAIAVFTVVTLFI